MKNEEEDDLLGSFRTIFPRNQKAKKEVQGKRTR